MLWCAGHYINWKLHKLSPIQLGFWIKSKVANLCYMLNFPGPTALSWLLIDMGSVPSFGECVLILHISLGKSLYFKISQNCGVISKITLWLQSLRRPQCLGNKDNWPVSFNMQSNLENTALSWYLSIYSCPKGVFIGLVCLYPRGTVIVGQNF